MDKKPDDKKEKVELSKEKFGSLVPLTALQIVALLAKSNTAFGGPCY